MARTLHRRILALDAGSRRVGVAISDELHMIASPVETVDLQRSGWERLLRLIDDYDPELIVVGMPTGLSGREGPQAQAARRFAEKIQQETGRPTRLHDERLTSFMAEQILIDAGRKPKQRKGQVDAIAAALILQSFLDEQRG
jgi:putative Holliday junction resolvase